MGMCKLSWTGVERVDWEICVSKETNKIASAASQPRPSPAQNQVPVESLTWLWKGSAPVSRSSQYFCWRVQIAGQELRGRNLVRDTMTIGERRWVQLGWVGFFWRGRGGTKRCA